MDSKRTMKPTAIILAAGLGMRMEGPGSTTPKGLLPFGDITPVGRTLGFLAAYPLHRVILVTGFEHQQYEELLKDDYPQLRLVHNPDFATTGSLYSLGLALAEVDGPAVIVESDLVYHRRILELALAAPWSDALLCSDLTGHGDEVYLWLDPDDRVIGINKQRLEGNPVGGEFVGISRWSTRSIMLMKSIFPQLCKVYPKAHYDEDGFGRLAECRTISIIRTGKLPWSEFDNPAMLGFAREVIFPEIIRQEDG